MSLTSQISKIQLRQIIIKQQRQFNVSKKPQTTYYKLLQQIKSGNKQLYLKYSSVISDLLKQSQYKQLSYQSITQLMISCIPSLIKDINNDILIEVQKKYSNKDKLDKYIWLWISMYNGNKERQQYPNLKNTFKNIQFKQKINITQFKHYLDQFYQNLEQNKEKVVQFFQDFQDSFATQSVEDQSRLSQIVYMDIMEIKAIRHKVEKQPLTEQMSAQYKLKMKTFLSLKPEHLSGDLLSQFNKQRIWAAHFIKQHQKYQKNIASSSKKISIQLTQDEQVMDVPDFSKLKKVSHEQPIKYEDHQIIVKRKLESISNKKIDYIINQMPMDQSKFTQRQDKNIILNNNSQSFGYLADKKNSLQNFIKTKQVQRIKNNSNYSQQSKQSMKFNPTQTRQNPVIHISKPIVSDQSFINDESFIDNSLRNISIPQQIINSATPKKKFQIPNANSVSRNTINNSNNPFTNSKTNYYKDNSSIGKFKRIQFDDAYSPYRQSMKEDDLDSQNMDDHLILKPHNQDNNNTKKYKEYSMSQQYMTQNLKAKPQYLTLADFQTSSLQKNLHSQQLSPRSDLFTKSTSPQKKRLSQLTSQKKMRRNLAFQNKIKSQPQQYVIKPYLNHFNNQHNFNCFKRNSWEDKFTLYVSEELLVICSLKKLNGSKLTVQIVFQNLTTSKISLAVLYKIPKCFQIKKNSKINRKFILDTQILHVFNLEIVEFPLEMCLMQLSYISETENSQRAENLHIPLAITIKNFIQNLVATKQQWMQNWQKLSSQGDKAFRLLKTFQLNRNVIQPSQLDRVFAKQFLAVGSIQGYSVQQYGCICYYKELNNLLFLVRVSIRVDHIVTIQVLSQQNITNNQRDFMNYYIELMVMLLAKYKF